MSYTLSNNFIKITFDKKTGAITGLLNKTTGWQVIRQPALSMGIQLLVPIEDHRNNRVLSDIQELTSFKVKSDHQVVLSWNTVVGDKSGPLDIMVELEVELVLSEVRFILSIDNQSKYVVEEAWCPCLGGLREAMGEPPLESMSLHFQGGMNKVRLGDGFPLRGYWGVNYPTVIKTFPGPEMTTSFVLLSNGIQGIYLGVHSYDTDIACFVHELKPGYLDSKHSRVPKGDMISGIPAGFVVSVARLPFINPGEKIVLAPVIINLFEGDWHKGIKPYMEWRKRWYKPVPRPGWLSDIDCWMTLQMNSPEGCCWYHYNELPDIMLEAKEKGVQVLQLIGWARDGQDGAEPYQDTDPRLGTMEELKNSISRIEKMGIHVLLMCKFKWVDRSIPEFETEMYRHTLKDMYGNYVQFGGYAYQTLSQQVAGGSIRSGAGLCHLSEEYRKLALREFTKILNLGPSGILYDELANNMLLCFDPDHGHRQGECNHKGSVLLAKEFYQLAQKKNSEFLLTGEGPSDNLTQYYSVNYIRSWDGNMGDQYHTPAWKYMDPDMDLATCIIGWDDREMVNQCITYGYIINYEPYNFKGRIIDFPATVNYGQMAQKLRRKLWEYLRKGKFLHTDGVKITVTGEGCEFIYSVFENRNNGKRAVVVANQGSGVVLEVKVELESGSGRFILHKIETDDAIESTCNIKVEPRSLCVMVEI